MLQFETWQHQTAATCFHCELFKLVFDDFRIESFDGSIC